jgi:hypothetical protein
VEDAQDGLLFDPGNVDDLALKLTRLLDDASLRAALAESGYRRVRHDFPASATRRRLLEAYQRILPATQAMPIGRAAGAIDGLPSHPDTTSRRQLPLSDISGVIQVPDEGEPRQVVIEALDFASAGEAWDATIEPLGASAEIQADLDDGSVEVVAIEEIPVASAEVTDDSVTRPIALRPPGEIPISEVPDFAGAGPPGSSDTTSPDHPLPPLDEETTHPGAGPPRRR